MKNKKYLSILIVFLALLFISIGYAAISKELFVNVGATTQKEGVSDDDTTSLAKNFVVLWDKDTKVIDDTFANNATKTKKTIFKSKNGVLKTSFFLPNFGIFLKNVKK